MNLNLHFHALVLDGVYTQATPEAAPVFHPLPPPTDAEIATLLERVHARVQRLLRRRQVVDHARRFLKAHVPAAAAR